MFSPPPTWISRVFDPSPTPPPPPARISIQNPISRGGVDFFLEQPRIEWLADE